MFDGSTAPTTPEGSLSFSPVLRPATNGDGLDDDSGALTAKSRNSSRSLSSARVDPVRRIDTVRNICCVGAGYVGVYSLRHSSRSWRLFGKALTDGLQEDRPRRSSPSGTLTSKSPSSTGMPTESAAGSHDIHPSTSPACRISYGLRAMVTGNSPSLTTSATSPPSSLPTGSTPVPRPPLLPLNARASAATFTTPR